MNREEAWAYIAERFENEANYTFEGNYSYVLIVPRANWRAQSEPVSSGICGAIEMLEDMEMITPGMSNLLFDEIHKWAHESGITSLYYWPSTVDGHKSRAEWCRSRLTKA